MCGRSHKTPELFETNCYPSAAPGEPCGISPTSHTSPHVFQRLVVHLLQTEQCILMSCMYTWEYSHCITVVAFKVIKLTAHKHILWISCYNKRRTESILCTSQETQLPYVSTDTMVSDDVQANNSHVVMMQKRKSIM